MEIRNICQTAVIKEMKSQFVYFSPQPYSPPPPGGEPAAAGLLAGILEGSAGVQTNPDEAFARLVMKIGGFCCKNGNSSALCKQLTQFNKNFKCFQKVAKAIDFANADTGLYWYCFLESIFFFFYFLLL